MSQKKKYPSARVGVFDIGELHAISRVLAKDFFNQIMKTAPVPYKETSMPKHGWSLTVKLSSANTSAQSRYFNSGDMNT